jgi:hypothetical protein
MTFRSKVEFIGISCKITAPEKFCLSRPAVLFCTALPFDICCEGRRGACKADMADDAVGPDVSELIV